MLYFSAPFSTNARCLEPACAGRISSVKPVSFLQFRDCKLAGFSLRTYFVWPTQCFLKFRICCQHKKNSDFWLLVKNESGHYQAHMSIRKQLTRAEQQLYPLDRPHGLQLTTDLPLILFPAHFSSQASVIQETCPAPVGRVYNYSLAVFLLDLNKYVPCGVERTATKTIQSCFLLKRACYFKKQIEGFQMANGVQPSFKDQNQLDFTDTSVSKRTLTFEDFTSVVSTLTSHDSVICNFCETLI